MTTKGSYQIGSRTAAGPQHDCSSTAGGLQLNRKWTAARLPVLKFKGLLDIALTIAVISCAENYGF